MVLLPIIFSSKSVTGDDDICEFELSCENCTTVRFCIPNPDGSGFIDYRKFECSGSAPFCDYETGSCQNMPTLNCTVKGEFVCLRDGTFPHPTDCTKYFVCVNLLSHTFSCPESYYHYDSKSEACSYEACQTFDCNAENGLKVNYPNDPAIYGYCINGEPLIIDRCAGRDELNSTSQKCEPICRHEGLIPDTKNSSNYYRCNELVGGQFIMTKGACPVGQTYTTDKFICETASAS